MTPEEYNNNLFPFLSAPKETLLIPSKPKTSVGPEVPQTKPGNLEVSNFKSVIVALPYLHFLLSFSTAVM